MRICFIGSGGGHFQQLCGLSSLAQKYDHFLISTQENKPAVDACPFQRSYLVDEIGQGVWKTHPCRMARLFLRVLAILRRERPSIVISTGSGIAVVGFLAAKLLRIHTVYVEVYARVESLSLAGRVCYRLSDLFLVQHAGLADKLARARYVGALYTYL